MISTRHMISMQVQEHMISMHVATCTYVHAVTCTYVHVATCTYVHVVTCTYVHACLLRAQGAGACTCECSRLHARWARDQPQVSSHT